MSTAIHNFLINKSYFPTVSICTIVFKLWLVAFYMELKFWGLRWCILSCITHILFRVDKNRSGAIDAKELQQALSNGKFMITSLWLVFVLYLLYYPWLVTSTLLFKIWHFALSLGYRGLPYNDTWMSLWYMLRPK